MGRGGLCSGRPAKAPGTQAVLRGNGLPSSVRTGTGQEQGGRQGPLRSGRAWSGAAKGGGRSGGLRQEGKKSVLEVTACESRRCSDVWLRDDPTVLARKGALVGVHSVRKLFMQGSK